MDIQIKGNMPQSMKNNFLTEIISYL